MLEQLWDESPTVQKMRNQSYEKGKGEGRAAGRAEGKAEGEVQTLQRAVVELVQVQFPILTELAQRQAQLCKNAEMLHTVMQQLYVVPDVSAVQRLLASLSE